MLCFTPESWGDSSVKSTLLHSSHGHFSDHRDRRSVDRYTDDRAQMRNSAGGLQQAQAHARREARVQNQPHCLNARSKGAWTLFTGRRERSGPGQDRTRGTA